MKSQKGKHKTGSYKTPVQRNYKDRIFCDLFGNPKHKEAMLSLYNAINGSNYTNTDDIEVVTLDDVIYAGMKNDVAFLFQEDLNLFEQQSSVNPNMPLRGFLYYAAEYSGMYWKKNPAIYDSTLLKIVTPNYVVLYNGTAEQDDKFDMKLSDAFIKPTTGYEWTAHVYNINYGKNPDIMSKCKTLSDYSTFIWMVRENQKGGMDVNTAVTKAVDDCIDNDILKKYLSKNRDRAISSLICEYDQEADLNYREKKGRKMGQKEGKKEGISLSAKIIKATKKYSGDNSKIALECGISVKDVKSIRKQLNI